jgi:FkbM family methyltransferase
MTVTTYAQNFEDVILDRVFQGKQSGFYIDVGAAHPVVLSVTKHFYDMGWHGINIEPIPEMHKLLEEQRSRDINLNIAAGAEYEIRSFYEAGIGEFSSFDEKYTDISQFYPDESKNKKNYKVEIRTLADICTQFCNQTIDFLKIDVEGFEKEVLLGADFDRFRPVVVVVEATVPCSPINPNSPEEFLETNKWETILTDKGYSRSYFDGRNCFYTRDEDKNNKSVFQIPVYTGEFVFPQLKPNLIYQYSKILPISIRQTNKNYLDISKKLDKKSTELDKVNETLKNKVEEEGFTKKELEKVRAELNESKTELNATRAELNESKTELNAARAEINNVIAEIERTKSQLDSTREEFEGTKARLSKAHGREELQRQDIIRLKDLLEKTQVQLYEQGTLLAKVQSQLRQEFTAHRDLAISWHAWHNRLSSWWLIGRLFSRIPLPKIPYRIPAIRTDNTPAVPQKVETAGVKFTTQKNIKNKFDNEPKTPQKPETTSVKFASKETFKRTSDNNPINKKPGNLFRYPDLTGARIYEGGNRLKSVTPQKIAQNPLVTVVTTVCNCNKHIEQTLLSVLEQTYSSIENIIIDAVSTDGTLDILKRYENKLAYILSEPDSGQYAGINKGIELAGGEYIMILNADDYYAPEAIEKLVNEAIEENADIVAADAHIINKRRAPMTSEEIDGIARSSWTPFAYLFAPLNLAAMLVKSSLYAQMGLYDEDLSICADWKWMADVYDADIYNVSLLQEALLYIRNTSRPSINNYRQNYNQERLDTMCRIFPEVKRGDLQKLLELPISDEEIKLFQNQYPYCQKLLSAIKAQDAWYYAKCRKDDFIPFQPLSNRDLHFQKDLRCYDKYPDWTGKRIIEGGIRLNGQKTKTSLNGPLVSVVTSVYNCAKYFEEAILSVLSQNYNNIEYIVVDGGSTDGTLDVLKKYQDKVDYFISEPDKGIYAGMNKGISLAKGDYIILLNADDYYVPEAIERLVDKALEDDFDLVIADSEMIDLVHNRRLPRPTILDERFFLRCTYSQETMLVHRRVYEKYGLYNETFKVLSDWIWLANIYKNLKIGIINENLLFFRKIGISSNDDMVSAKEKFVFLRNKIPGLEWKDSYMMRYPHHLTIEQAYFLKNKYHNCPTFQKSIDLFIKHDLSN